MTDVSTKWYNEQQDRSWSALWTGYIVCGRCHGIRQLKEPCAACGDPSPNTEWTVIRLDDGREERVASAFMGAEGRYEDWMYLNMMEHEWKRPVLETDRFPSSTARESPSPRASIVILFWSYFETRIDRLLRAGLDGVPERLKEDALKRYSSIGSRMNEFYRIVFDSTYREDLQHAGYPQIWTHISTVQERRNRFAHGWPQAIDDALVQTTVELLKAEHEAWIAVFNKRVARA